MKDSTDRILWGLLLFTGGGFLVSFLWVLTHNRPSTIEVLPFYAFLAAFVFVAGIGRVLGMNDGPD